MHFKTVKVCFRDLKNLVIFLTGHFSTDTTIVQRQIFYFQNVSQRLMALKKISCLHFLLKPKRKTPVNAVKEKKAV